MSNRWVRSVDGQLVNLDRCVRVYLQEEGTGYSLVAFAPGPAHHVLARLPNRDEALAALDRLSGALEALTVLAGEDVPSSGSGG